MAQGKDIFVELNGLMIIHQRIRGRELADHEHDEHEFFFPIQGEIQIDAEGQTLKAGPGKLIYLPPKLVHAFRSDTASQGERVILIINKKLWTKHGGEEFSAKVISASQLCKEITFQLLLHPQTKAASALIQTLIQTLSEMLEAGVGTQEVDPFHLEGRVQDERMRKSLEVIASEFAGSLSIEKIARASGLSVRNLNRLFLKELGMTPKQAITQHRIQHAKALLGQGRTSVTDVAFEVGYNSVSQFISTFRKYTGQLPSSFLPGV